MPCPLARSTLSTTATSYLLLPIGGAQCRRHPAPSPKAEPDRDRGARGRRCARSHRCGARARSSADSRLRARPEILDGDLDHANATLDHSAATNGEVVDGTIAYPLVPDSPSSLTVDLMVTMGQVSIAEAGSHGAPTWLSWASLSTAM